MLSPIRVIHVLRCKVASLSEVLWPSHLYTHAPWTHLRASTGAATAAVACDPASLIIVLWCISLGRVRV